VEAPAADGAALAQTCLCPPGQSQPDAEGYCQMCGVRSVPAQPGPGNHVEMAVDARLAFVSDIGRKHRSNEDTGAVARGSDGSVVLVVADGVSTSLNSASASQAAVEAALGVLSSWPQAGALTDAAHAAVEAANQAVLALPIVAGDTDGPETTIVVALCRGGRLAIGWVGDSRAYLVSPDTGDALTVDDSWVEQIVRSGEMSLEQAESDKRAHYVTQVLGMRDQPLDVHVLERELPGNSVLLLCSDGLWNYFERAGEVAEAVRQREASEALALCRELVDMANARGGHDNVTVAVLRETA
jgi:serine/threonine protein phosphatase PrpC